MSTKYKLPTDDQEMIFYFPPEIVKNKEHLNLKSIFYVRRVLDKLINSYNIQNDLSIGFCTDIKTAEFLMADLIEGYLNYWGEYIPCLADDIDFENPCHPILRFPGAL